MGHTALDQVYYAPNIWNIFYLQACSLSNDNLLLAGTVLKNTGHVFACCVYAGTQTKISLNSKITKNKFSTLERSLNKYLIVMVVILMLEMTTSTILSFTFDHEFRKVRQDWNGTISHDKGGIDSSHKNK